MLKAILFITFLMTFVSAPAAQGPSVSPSTPVTMPSPYTRPDAGKRFKHFAKDLAGPAAWGGMLGGAAFSTAINSPEEWGGTWEGFGKRVASNFGKNVIRSSVTYGLDEALKLDSHFYKSEKRTVGARIKNALISPVTARKANGKRTIGIPKIVGTYSANLIAYELWYPARYSVGDAMVNGTITLGSNAVYNLVKEFVFRK